jgi:hypothetical protein
MWMSPPVPSGRLDSWKEVAEYLHRSVRTVARWERFEHLPVHRLAHDRRGSVYAYRGELDRWLRGRTRGPHGLTTWLRRLAGLLR